MPKKKQTKQKISKNMTIASVVSKYPQTASVFISYGMHCFGCAMAANETVEQGAKAHPDINLNKLLIDLNKSASQKLDLIEEKISKLESQEKPKKVSFFKKLFGGK